mmetsp:Transcript_54408/g.153234  ORF Transcript_54408/g.153234 Transcript_54408/m.153234 type:complete len:257 (-) Transcript_54408:368-1138(-)
MHIVVLGCWAPRCLRQSSRAWRHNGSASSSWPPANSRAARLLVATSVSRCALPCCLASHSTRRRWISNCTSLTTAACRSSREVEGSLSETPGRSMTQMSHFRCARCPSQSQPSRIPRSLRPGGCRLWMLKAMSSGTRSGTQKSARFAVSCSVDRREAVEALFALPAPGSGGENGGGTEDETVVRVPRKPDGALKTAERRPAVLPLLPPAPAPAPAPCLGVTSPTRVGSCAHGSLLPWWFMRTRSLDMKRAGSYCDV